MIHHDYSKSNNNQPECKRFESTDENQVYIYMVLNHIHFPNWSDLSDPLIWDEIKPLVKNKVSLDVYRQLKTGKEPHHPKTWLNGPLAKQLWCYVNDPNSDYQEPIPEHHRESGTLIDLSSPASIVIDKPFH